MRFHGKLILKNNIYIMRKLYYSSLILMVLLINASWLFAQSVETNWILYPHSVNLNSSPPAVTNLPGANPNTTTPYVDANGAFDQNGNLLFYIVEESIYNSSGASVGYLDFNDGSFSLPMRETTITPVPGNINKFYVIYSFGRSFTGQDVLYSTIDCSNGNCTIINNGNLLNHSTAGNINGIAVSRLFSNNTRRMYLASYGSVKRFEISSSGISFVENILAEPNSYGLGGYDFDAFQLEISNDASKLAWGALNELGFPYLHIIDLTSQGSFSNYADVLITDGGFTPNSSHRIYGVEFSSDNTKVYASVWGNTSPSGGIFCYNFANNQLTNVIYNNYNRSHLQSDGNGFVYAVANGGNALGRIDPNTNIFTQSFLAINVLSGQTSGGWELFSLPDLIDYNSILELNATTTDETCASSHDGTASVTVNGGVPPYTYHWNDPLAQTTPTATNLSHGTYTCTVVDAFNASISIDVEVVTNPALFTHTGNWDVYTLDGFNGFAAVDGNIEIFNGGTFIADGTLEFNENSGIIIHNGGTLIIADNSIISGLTACGNNLWDGIVVEEQGIIQIDNAFTISRGNFILKTDALVNLYHKTILFDRNSVIIEPGGELILDGSLLTAPYGYNWTGIEVWGNTFADQFEYTGHPQAQGKLVLKNNATIENAWNAIITMKPDDWNTCGGIVSATNSFFKNNKRTIAFMPYQNHHPISGVEMPYSSSFTNCSFTIDDQYTIPSTFNTHITMCGTNGIRIKGCEFANNKTGAEYTGKGIYTMNAGYQVLDYCNSTMYPCPNPTHTTFSNLEVGIGALNSNSPYTIYASHAEFNNNSIGVQLNSVNNATLIFNEFQMGLNLNCTDSDGIGIDLTNCNGYAVEENEFRPISALADETIGVRVRSTNKDVVVDNEVYNNIYDGVYIGSKAEDINFNTEGQKGLSFLCGHNTDNIFDHYIADFGIKQFQGVLGGAPAGNEFSLNANNPYSDYNNQSDWTILYFYDQNSIPQTPVSYSQKVIPIPTTISNQCTSHYGGGIQSKGMGLSLAQSQYLKDQFYSSKSSLIGTKALYNSLVDGGNTPGTIADVENAWPSEMWETRAALLAKSPHLSREVLVETANRTDLFPDAVIFEILSANPDAMKDETLLTYLETKENPLPQYMIEILRSSIGTITYKTILENQLADYGGKMQASADIIIRNLLNDSIPQPDSLKTWLTNSGTLVAGYQLVDVYLQEGNVNAAAALLAALPATYGFENTDIEYGYYVTLKELQFDLLTEGRNVYMLTNQEETVLEVITANSISTAGMQARNILQFVYGNDYYDCSNMPDPVTFKNGNASINSLMANMLEIESFPNPAKDWTTFTYKLPETENSAVIEISDVTGKTVQIIHLTTDQGQVVWDTRKSKPGIYLYTLKASGTQKTGKIVVTK
ncbi:MAG: hypothetical protein CO098_09575 [Bacteroidetes bacterium CG_4_9_14_3_um_filter_41_19]|nr:MAG: hypothetical protein CO098_09575 [Bacteroidetes bacterium CG_4_9_14_3_um_filter_41_19]